MSSVHSLSVLQNNQAHGKIIKVLKMKVELVTYTFT